MCRRSKQPLVKTIRSPRARRASGAAVRAFAVRILSGIVPCAGILPFLPGILYRPLSPVARFLTIPPADAGGNTVVGVRFERLPGEGHHYPVLFHVGNCYVPVTEHIVNELKACALMPGERFLEVLIDKLGYSEYLKERIREELKKTGDPVTQATVLQGAVRDL